MSEKTPPHPEPSPVASSPLTEDPAIGRWFMPDTVYQLNMRTIWALLKREPWHFWFFCGYLFFEYVRPQGIYRELDILPWARLCILGAAALFLVSTERKTLASPLSVPFYGFFVVAFLSGLMAQYPAYSTARFDTLVNWALLYTLFVWIVDSRFRFFIVMLLLILASFKMAQHGFRISASRGFGFSAWGVGGPPGFFQNAADLGVQMAIYIPWTIAFYLGCRQFWSNRWLKLLFLFAPITGFATAAATGQRNTALALAAMALATVAFTQRRLRNLLLVALAGTLTWSYVLPDEYKARFETAGTDITSESRLHYWKRGLEIYRSHPVLGVGYANWVPYFASRYPGESLGSGLGEQEVAHSVPISIAAETGTLGLIFYYLLVLKIFLVNRTSARLFATASPPLWRYYALSLNFGLIGFLTAGIFLSIQYYPFLWVQAGLSAALYRIACQPTPEAHSPS